MPQTKGPSPSGNSGERVALVTGGNRGLGFEIASQLARRGYTVAIGSRSIDLGCQSATRLNEQDLRAFAVELDVTQPDSIERAVARIIGRYARIDVLVNNAGIAIDAWPSHRPSVPNFDKIEATFETNLYGAWRCAGAVLPYMRAGSYGRIVNISSNMASIEMTEDQKSPAYRISKAALNMLTVVLAADARDDGILVNAASPGYTRTDMSPNASRTVEEGADTPVWLATLPDSGPTGGYFFERSRYPW